MRTYMRGDFVCCQSHEEVCSDSEFKPDVFLSPGGRRGGGYWLYYEAEATADPAVPTFFNFWGQFNESSTGLLLMRLTLTFIAKLVSTSMG